MSPEARLGQLFMLSYSGEEPTPLLYSWIRGNGLGGVKIFGWNADDTGKVAASIQAIQKAAGDSPLDIPPFIATDQEGGWIRHIRGQTSITPGNMAIGASAWPTDAYQSAYYIGMELASLGVTMNFAPTVDLATRPDSTIIGPRAFSSDPTGTGILAAAWVRGMADAGVMATAKHYPGHGDTELDSHGTLPVIGISEETLWNRELVPYRILTAEGIPGIMTGHLAFPQIVSSGEPASLSPYLIQDLLRGRMGYEGLVITDDLMMTGASSSGGLAVTSERAIRAGNDIIMFSRTLSPDEEVWTRLASLYRRDPEFKARVDASTRRILVAKLRWLLPLGRTGIGPANNPDSTMRSPQSREFFTEQAMRSATLLGRAEVPIPAAGRLLVAGPFGDFMTEAQSRLPKARMFRFTYLPAEGVTNRELAEFSDLLQGVDTAVICVANTAGASFAKAVLDAGKKLYVVSSLSPTYSLAFAEDATIVAVYSYARESFKAAFAVLAGDVEAPGRLPIDGTR
jgi:beta-N-acetylhexosaminidase